MSNERNRDIVNLDKKAVDIEKVLEMSNEFQNTFSFEVCSVDDNGQINSAIYSWI